MGLRGIVMGLAASTALLSACPAVAGPTRLPAPARTGGSCPPGDAPFGDLPGAQLTATVHVSKDADPFSYVMWRGTVPSFDGLPLSVDVTLPCRTTDGPLPTVVVLHGFTDDKTIWEETGKSDTVESVDRPGANSRWNNIWFASRGYGALTYTARGWHDSCGPDTPGGTADAPPPQCADHEYWIHLDDKRWEVRDAQWLTAGLVSGGTADPDRLAITGGSYGGAPTSSAALLADQTMCGGAPVPAELGPDPCEGKANGVLVPWTTRDATTELSWAAALPLYTFSDLLRVLAPNGRWSDGAVQIAPGGSTTQPFGVPLESTISALILAGQVYGRFAPEGADPDSDVLMTTDRLLAGDPYDPDDPIVAQGASVYERFKSPITTEVQGRVPVFLVQGFTDALFPASEAVAMIDHLQATDPDYSVKAFFGDIGHDYAAERQDDWDLVKDQMNGFLDHYLDPDRTPAAPVFDVGASVTRCLPVDAPQSYVAEESWQELHDDTVTFTSDDHGATSTATAGPAGVATDPISTGTLPGPESYKGCRIMRPSETDPTTATYAFDVDEDLVLMGAPVVDLEVTASGPDTPLAVRIWDVTADGSAQALVTRGVYRMVAPAPKEATQVRFQIAPQAYSFAKGHQIKVEVTANDAPYLLANNGESKVTVSKLTLELPARTAGSAERLDPVGSSETVALPSEHAAGPPPWVWGALVGGIVLLVGDLAFIVGRRRRRRGRGDEHADTDDALDGALDGPSDGAPDGPSDGAPAETEVTGDGP